MPSFFRREHYFGASYITGPQWLKLLLDLDNERIEDPEVTALEEDRLYGNPDVAAVRLAVLAGTDEANREYDSNFHPLEVRYAFSSWDKNCNLMRRAAHAIVERLARLGAERFAGSD